MSSKKKTWFYCEKSWKSLIMLKSQDANKKESNRWMQTLQETSGLFQCWVFCTCTLLWNDPGPTEKPCDLPRERVPNQPKAGRGVPSPLCVAPSTWQDSARARKQPYLLAFLAESSQNTSPKLQGKKKKKPAQKYRAQLRIEPKHWWQGGPSGFSSRIYATTSASAAAAPRLSSFPSSEGWAVLGRISFTPSLCKKAHLPAQWGLISAQQIPESSERWFF